MKRKITCMHRFSYTRRAQISEAKKNDFSWPTYYVVELWFHRTLFVRNSDGTLT